MYNQDIIDGCGESRIKKLIEIGATKIPIDSLDRRDILTRHAIENYILKYYKNPHSEQEDIRMHQYINRMYDMFLNEPLIFVHTKLFDHPNCKILFSEQQNAKIDNKKRRVVRSAHRFYIESKSRELNDKEKDILMSVFIKMIDTSNESMQAAIKDYAKRLLSREEVPRNRNELLFALTYANHVMLSSKHYRDKVIPSVIALTKEKPTNGGSSGSGLITMNVDLKNATLPLYMEIICHETEHLFQVYEAIHNPRSLVGLNHAIHQLLIRHYSKDGYNPYRRNYRYSDIEIDAENIGMVEAGFVYASLDLYNMSRRVHQDTDARMKRRAIEYEHAIDSSGRMVPQEHFIVTHMNAIMKKFPEYLSHFPVLSQLYRENGEMKSFQEMLSMEVMVNESDYYQIFDDYLIQYIKNGELENLSLDQFSGKSRAYAVKHLISLFRDETAKISAMSKSFNTSKLPEDDKKRYAQYHMRLALSLGKFVTNNLMKIESMADNEELGPFLSHNRYLMDIQTLMHIFESYNRDDGFKESCQRYKPRLAAIFDKTYLNHCTYYMRKKMKGFTPEELEQTVSLPDGTEVSFREYCEGYMPTRLDTAMYFISEAGEHLVPTDVMRDVLQEGQLSSMMKEDESVVTHTNHNHK